MSTHFSDAQIRDYRATYETHGVLRLPGLIDPAKATEILAVIDDVAAKADQPPADGSIISYGRGTGRMTIRQMWRDIPAIRAFLLDGDLGHIIARIVGAKQLRFWFDLTFLHNGQPDGREGEGTAWHHDIAAFSFQGMQIPSLWMALTPATRENSRLEFIDGSHRTVPGYYRAPTPNPNLDDGFLTCPDFDALVAEGREKLISWDCAPGDAILIHPFTIHGARGNAGTATQGRRVAITTRWLGDDVRWLPLRNPPSRMHGVKESGITIGSRPRGDWFPLVHDEFAEGEI